MMRFLDFEKPIYDIEVKLEELRLLAREHPELEREIKRLEEQAEKIRDKIYKNLTPWQKTQLARHPDRPHAIDFIQGMCEDFLELHGDRAFRDDPSIIAGIGKLDNFRVVIIGQEKGRDTREKIIRNWGMPHPEGYRKAARCMLLAEKFFLPIISLVDTPGAYPGIGAEERGQATLIASNLEVMLNLKVPLISVVIGEGGSGGALAIALGNVVLALQYAIYSVISPEGCASILWRDAKEASRAAEALRLTSDDLLELKVIDEIIPEPPEGAHKDPGETIKGVKERIIYYLEELTKLDSESLIKTRQTRYKQLGIFAS